MADFSLADLASDVGAEVRGDATLRVRRIATLGGAGPGDLSFLSNSRYRRQLRDTRATAVILAPEDADDCPVAAIVIGNPHLAYARIAQRLAGSAEAPRGVHPSAVVEAGAQVDASAWIGPQACIEAGARIGAGCFVGPGCVVGRGARLGRDCHLVARVVVAHGVILGERVTVYPGAVIGGDGFGFARDGARWVKIPQVGTVRIGDDVEIGSNTTIDRGSLEDTVIERGVKLDNQIQVAHNVHIGEDTAIAGCVGIAGSARIGRRCTIGGAAGVIGHLEIVDDVHVTAMSLVTRSINRPGTYSSGTPLEPNADWQRNAVRFKQLDRIARRLKAVEERLPEGDESDESDES